MLEAKDLEGGQIAAPTNHLTISIQISPVVSLKDASSPGGNHAPESSSDDQDGVERLPLLGQPTSDNIYAESSEILPVVVHLNPRTLSIATNLFLSLLNGGSMALCKRCALNGDRRDGGGLGVCKIHAKSKCRAAGCEAKTLGAELCTAHAHELDIARWTARAQLRVLEPGADLDQAELRREKLNRAKFLAHEAVEVFFRSLLEASQAIHGSADDEESRAA